MSTEKTNQKNTWAIVFCIILAILLINDVFHIVEFIKTTADPANHSIGYRIGWVIGISLKPLALLYMLLFLFWKFILNGFKNRNEA